MHVHDNLASDIECPPSYLGILRVFVLVYKVRPQSVDSWDGGFFTRVFAAVGR